MPYWFQGFFMFTRIPGEMIQCEGCICFKGGWSTNHQLVKKHDAQCSGFENPKIPTERSLLFEGRFWRHFFSLEGEICGS